MYTHEEYKNHEARQKANDKRCMEYGVNVCDDVLDEQEYKLANVWGGVQRSENEEAVLRLRKKHHINTRLYPPKAVNHKLETYLKQTKAALEDAFNQYTKKKCDKNDDLKHNSLDSNLKEGLKGL